MVRDARRWPARTESAAHRRWTPLCVSNPELHRAIVERAWDGGDVLTLGEADAGGESMCQCPRCLAWDGPQPTDVPDDFRLLKYTPRTMGDRYARFWKTVYDLAVKRNPHVKIGVYLYHNTLPAPTAPIELNRNIHGEFVIYGSRDGWYPVSEEEDALVSPAVARLGKDRHVLDTWTELPVEQLRHPQHHDAADR